MNPHRLILSAVLLGLSLSSFGLALMLLILLSRFAKDVNEVLATWQYIHSEIVVGVVALAGWFAGRRQTAEVEL